MKAILLFLVVVLAITAEAAVRGKSHKTQAKAPKDEPASEPGDDGNDDGDVEWPHPNSIKSFSGDGEFNGHGAFEAGDHTESSTKKHSKAGRKSHSH